MKTFYTILISVLVSLAVILGVVVYILNYVPFSALDWLILNKPQTFGTTLTDLQSSDTMSDFPILYNANNSALNSGKIDVGSSSISAITTLSNLTSIGTIGTGVWNGTAIGVSKGGTGTTSPSQYLVILGNGAAGFTVASSTGTSGQALVSNGAGLYPTWQSIVVNQGDNYNWTGAHNFTGATRISNLHASSTLTINGLALSFPSYQPSASSTVLANNGSGSLSFMSLGWDLLGETTLSADGNSISVTIAAKSDLVIKLYIASSTATTYANMTFNSDTGSNYTFRNWVDNVVSDLGQTGTFIRVGNLTLASTTYSTINIVNPSNNYKIIDFSSSSGTGTSTPVFFTGTGSWNNATQVTTITITASSGNYKKGSWIKVFGTKN